MRKKNILIVEDESITALDLTLTFERFGFHIVGVSSSFEEAVHQSHSRAPDLICMDIKIQGERDGIAAAAEIRRTLDVPIVFMSANVDSATRARAESISTLFVEKPFREKELLQVVTDALKQT